MSANCYQNLESVNEASRSSEPRSLKLIFSTGVASPVITGRKIRGEGGGGGGGNESIGVVLVDSQSHQIVVSGPAASATVKIVLLPGDFGGATIGDGSIWTPLEFKNSIITTWKKKKNLLLGDLCLVLKHGSGTVGEIKIKHDRNYLSKVKFRLGAMVVNCSDNVKEALTDPFEIKDGRNELINKNQPLLQTDKVWQLKNIWKKGPIRKRLEGAGIVTVKDFLDRLYSNPLALQEIYGSNGKKWKTTVRHAKTCIDDNVHNVYRSDGSTSQLWNNVPFVDHDGCNELDVEPYRPGPLSDDTTTVGDFPSAQCIEACLEILSQHGNHWFEPCQAYQEDGASTMVGRGGGVEGDMAHKRWIKLCRVWFSVRSFTKKVGGA